MAYTSEEIPETFWAEYPPGASGRDPLAIQNSSVVIYTKMVVGITNVTNRIRYNGFYCWLINSILKTDIEKKNSLAEQIRYIRRAELLLAYMMVNQFPDITGISGSAYAGRTTEPVINLKQGADLESKKEGPSGLYWQFKFGVFGQYYSGVVRELDLINHPQGDLKIYTLTNKGRELAAVFAKNISKNAAVLFLQAVLDGTINEDHLPDLKDFALHTIPEDSEEKLFYEKMLLSKDDRKIEATFHRRNTIILILDFLHALDNGTEDLPAQFLRYNYKIHIAMNEISDSTASAWYLFEINELLHVVFEHFHACFLHAIETYPTPTNDCINWLLEQTMIALENEGVDGRKVRLEQLADVLQQTDKSVYDIYDAMEQAFKDGDFGTALSNAIHTLIFVYRDCKRLLPQLKVFAALPEYHFNRRGYALELIEDLLETKWNLTLLDYTRSVILMAINVHIFTSYSKTKIGQGLVHNYLIEDNTVWRLRGTLPNRTTPRLQNASQYIADIGWIKKEGRHIAITERGFKIKGDYEK